MCVSVCVCVCVCVCAPRSLEPPWELGVLELEELPLLVLFRGVSMETSVLRRSGLLRQHKHTSQSHSCVKKKKKHLRFHRAVCVCVWFVSASPELITLSNLKHSDFK